MFLFDGIYAKIAPTAMFCPVHSTKPLSSFWTCEELPVAVSVDTHFF